MDVRLLFLMCALLFFITNVSAGIYKHVDEKGNVSFSDHPEAAERIAPKNTAQLQPDTQTGNNQLPVGILKKDKIYQELFKDGTIVLNVRDLFLNRKFAELNAVLHDYQKAVELNIINEDELYTAYSTFDVTDDAYKAILDSWIVFSPGSYQPYLARARYFHSIGWKMRGGQWASETSKKQFEQMAEYFTKAIKDILVVLKINKNVPVTYSTLIAILQTDGEREQLQSGLQSAMEIFPATYRVRLSFMHSATPRWGGSFELMRSVADQSQIYSSENRKLKLLMGYPDLEAGNMKALVRQYNEAEKLYTKSLSYGENHEVLFARGKNRYRQKKYTEALKDLGRAIDLSKESGKYYYWRSKVYWELELFDEAVNDIEYASKLDYIDDSIKSQLEWLASRLVKNGYDQYKKRIPAAAIKFYTQALRLIPDNSIYYYRRARALIDENNFPSAITDTKKAIDLNPSNYDAYLLLDWLLTKQGDWDSIISYWDRYIALNPDHSRAYVERGGAYFRRGNIGEAVKNAKIAADMGNVEGQEAYDKFKHLVKSK